MKDCSEDIHKYHDDEVTLSPDTRSTMRGNRDANRDRIRSGLKKLGKPARDKSIIQGSYAMKTMTQHPKNDYDIDDGAAFAAKKLQHEDGKSFTPKEAKEMVRDALMQDGRLPKDPEVKPNCVRVKYAAGHHVDIPVYRTVTDGAGNETMELAGETWRKTNPTEITDWFQDEEQITHDKDHEDEPQLRRLTRLTKKYSRANLEKDSLSGLVLTILVAEVHNFHDSREDNAFSETLRKIKERLETDKVVYNPADPAEELTKEGDDDKCEALIEKIEESLETLEILDDPDCTKAEAREAWDSAFKTDYFSKLQDDDQGGKAPYTPSKQVPKTPASVSGPGTAA